MEILDKKVIKMEENKFDKSVLHNLIKTRDEIPIIYFSYLKPGYVQKLTLNFKTIQSILDNRGRIDHSIKFQGIAWDVATDINNYNNKTVSFIAPQKTLWKAFLSFGRNPEEFIDNGSKVSLELIFKDILNYEILTLTV